MYRLGSGALLWCKTSVYMTVLMYVYLLMNYFVYVQIPWNSEGKSTNSLLEQLDCTSCFHHRLWGMYIGDRWLHGALLHIAECIYMYKWLHGYTYYVYLVIGIFLFFFFFLQHFIFVISAFLAWLIPDVPQSVKNEIQKEKLLAFEAVHARQQAGKDLGVKAEAPSPSPPPGGEGTEFW